MTKLCIRGYPIRSSQGTLWATKDATRPQADSKDSDQPAQMRRLIWVFAERSCNLVENAVPLLVYYLSVRKTKTKHFKFTSLGFIYNKKWASNLFLKVVFPIHHLTATNYPFRISLLMIPVVSYCLLSVVHKWWEQSPPLQWVAGQYLVEYPTYVCLYQMILHQKDAC